ncbi:hypothetical protein C8J57DRAFT_1574934 [Mycena rebaudengoi]|nr:hypothetical protein C8J57DRAFT_1574934 [Mycena rebaudengoi]
MLQGISILPEKRESLGIGRAGNNHGGRLSACNCQRVALPSSLLPPPKPTMLPAPSLLDNNHTENYNKCYLICFKSEFHHTRKSWFHFWSLSASMSYPLHPGPAPSPAVVTPQAPFRALPPPKPTCSHPRCKNTRVATDCKSLMCKEHCISRNGGACPVVKHHPRYMSARQRQKAIPTAQRSKAAPPFSSSDLAILSQITDTTNAIWTRAPALQRAVVDAPGIALDEQLGRTFSLSPSPEPRHLPPPSRPSPIPHPMLPSNRRSNSHPPLDGQEELELEHALQLSMSPDLEVVGALAPTASSSRRLPCITTHLNPTWMAQASKAVTPSSDDTFNIRQPSLHKPAINISTDDKPTAIVSIQECPSWPYFHLAESGQAIDLIGEGNDNVEFYDIRFRTWVRITISYTHTLTPNTYILLRRCRVTNGQDQNLTIDRFTNLPGPQHIRHNLPGERAAVRHKLKIRKRAHPRCFDSDDSDIEIIPNKRAGLVDDSDVEVISDKPEANGALVVQEPRVAVLRRPVLPRIITHGTSSYPIHLDSPPSSSSTSPSALFSPTHTPSTPSTPVEPSAASPIPRRWPSGLYAVDMANGFMRMEGRDLQHLSVDDRFLEVFEAPYVGQTYRDQRRRWAIAPESLRTAVCDAGRTPSGKGLIAP